MVRLGSIQKSLLGVVILGLVGITLGFASKHFLPLSRNDRAEPTGSESDNWWTLEDADSKAKIRDEPAPISPARDGDPNKRALLVGVTRYDNLAATSHLNGPGNDVRLLRTTLIESYGFRDANVVSLTEDEGKPELRPTRANVAREFQRLAEAAQAGDQVVVLLAGHGDRQPEADPPDPTSPEPDGIDEIFLPADVDVWKGRLEQVPNAVIDNEIRDWLGAITAKKAYVWAIFDCCHSASLTRDSSEVLRQLPRGVLVPPEELARARARASKRTGHTAAQADKQQFGLGSNDYLVATFACLAHETTPETLQPENTPAAKYYGLLTYSVASVLEQSAASATPVTYRELMQRVQLKYLSRPQGSPTPTVEGTGQDRIVLGTARPIRPKITLGRVKGEYVVNVGDLHGISPGSILRVHSPAGEKLGPEVVGHVQIVATRSLDSTVSPIEFEGKVAPSTFPTAGLCEVVAVDYSSRRLRLGIDPGQQKPDTAKQQIVKALRAMPERDGSLFELVDDGRMAHWLVRLSETGPELVDASGNRTPVPLPPLDSERFGESLTTRLKTIYRAQSLLAVGTRLESERNRSASGPDLRIEVLSHRTPDDPGVVIERPPGGWVFRPGDRISFRITNTSKTKRLEVTLLLVDPDYQILVFYPGKYEVNKALEPGAVVTTGSGTISEKPPFGPECLVAIVTAPTNPPIDYRLLIQPGIRAKGDAPKSPLAQLLDRTLNGSGSRSGLAALELEDQGAQVLHWQTQPTPQK